MITNLYFVRHAHSIYSTDELGRPLSEQGLIDAKEVTDLLIEEDIDIVVSSPYKRAYQTVEGIALHLEQEIEINDDLKERVLSEQPVDNFNEAILQVWSDFDFSHPSKRDFGEICRAKCRNRDTWKSNGFNNELL